LKIIINIKYINVKAKKKKLKKRIQT